MTRKGRYVVGYTGQPYPGRQGFIRGFELHPEPEMDGDPVQGFGFRLVYALCEASVYTAAQAVAVAAAVLEESGTTSVTITSLA